MPPDADDDLASDRALADAIIRDAFRRDADRVVAVVAEVIERLKAKRGYSAQELEAAAQALLDELSAPPLKSSRSAFGPSKAAGDDHRKGS